MRASNACSTAADRNVCSRSLPFFLHSMSARSVVAVVGARSAMREENSSDGLNNVRVSKTK